MSNAMSDARKKQDGTTTSSMTDAEFARYLHANRLDWIRRFLGSAIRWRDVSRDCATAGARAQAAAAALAARHPAPPDGDARSHPRQSGTPPR